MAAPEAGTDQADRDARFREYVLPELDVMYRVARSLTRNPTDAEDLVQDTLLRAYRAIDRFAHPAPLGKIRSIVAQIAMSNR